MGILAATEQLNGGGSGAATDIARVPRLGEYVIVGELGLEGDLRPVRGVLSIALSAKAAGLRGVIVPRSNLAEAGVVRGVEVLGADTLADVAEFFASGKPLQRADVDTAALFVRRVNDDVDFAEVKGQEHVKRALEIAAAGPHNVILL